MGEASGGGGGSAGMSGTAGNGAASGSAGSATGGAAGSGGSGASGSGGVLVSGPDAAQGLALDDQNVFFGIGKDVWRVPKQGGEKQLVSSGLIVVREVVTSGGFVYFLDGDKTIRRAASTGSSAELVVQGAGEFEQYGDIATDGSYVYFTTTTDQVSFGGAILRVPVTGGVPFEIHKVISAGEPHGIALLGSEVFWTQHRGGELYKAPIGGGGATQLSTGLAGPWKVAPTPELVYWTETLGSLAYKHYGGMDIVVPSSGPGDDVVLDDTNVYFSAPAAGVVYGAQLASTNAVVIAECTLPGALALDASYLYVACNGSPGAVLRVAK